MPFGPHAGRGSGITVLVAAVAAVAVVVAVAAPWLPVFVIVLTVLIVVLILLNSEILLTIDLFKDCLLGGVYKLLFSSLYFACMISQMLRILNLVFEGHVVFMDNQCVIFSANTILLSKFS